MKKSDYNNIAKFYDTVLGDSSDTEKYIKNKLKEVKFKSANPGGKFPELLELGCGTGNNLFFLKDKFETTGIDLSEQMLKIAKKKLPGTNFYLKDIRDFNLNKKFDLILCLYDTINHLTLFTDWQRVFKNVNNHLETDGTFIFDINTLHKLKLISAISPIVNKFDSNYLLVDVKNISGNVFNWNLKVFENLKKSNFNLAETNIKESSFEITKIIKELSKHFKIKKIEEESGKRRNRNSERLYFICQKININSKSN